MHLHRFCFLGFVCIACAEGTGKPGGMGSLAGSTSVAAGGAGQGGEEGLAGQGGQGGSGSLGVVCSAPIDLGVRFVGRVDGCDPTGVRFAWSGSGLVGKFQGTGVSLRVKGQANQYTVLVDGVLGPTLKTTAAQTLYPLATGLADGEHVIEVYRRTEASFGFTLVLGLDVEGGQLLPPPAPPERRIEIIGDSISCGYGDEGTAPCSFGPDTENHYLAYGPVLARELGAEEITVAWSGKGMVHNYNGQVLRPIPQIYDLAVPVAPNSLWDFSWKPQAVIINVGTNDYSTSGKEPTDAEFVQTYTALLEHIRTQYPGAFMLCTVGPMLSGTGLTRARTNIAAAVAARVAAGDTQVEAYSMLATNPNPGCDYHPNLTTQQAMATELKAELEAKVSW